MYVVGLRGLAFRRLVHHQVTPALLHRQLVFLHGVEQAHQLVVRLPPGQQDSALAQAILSILTDPLHGYRLGEEGRRRAVQQFDERRVFARVLAEYDRLLREKGLAERVPAAAPQPEEAHAATR